VLRWGQVCEVLASSVIDISDACWLTLVISARFKPGAHSLILQACDFSDAAQSCAAKHWGKHCVLSGGDDYDLCFYRCVGRHDELCVSVRDSITADADWKNFGR